MKLVLRIIGVVVMVAFAPLILHAVPKLGGADASYVVLSGSMSPTFNAGDYIMSKAFRVGGTLNVGDVITFRDAKGVTLTTHRVADITGPVGSRMITTKGDANNSPDPNQVPESRIAGVYMYAVPYYGYAAHLAGQPIGKILFIVIPCAITALWEGLKIARRMKADKPGATTVVVRRGGATLASPVPIGAAAGAPQSAKFAAVPKAAVPGTSARFEVVRR